MPSEKFRTLLDQLQHRVAGAVLLRVEGGSSAAPRQLVRNQKCRFFKRRKHARRGWCSFLFIFLFSFLSVSQTTLSLLAKLAVSDRPGVVCLDRLVLRFFEVVNGTVVLYRTSVCRTPSAQLRLVATPASISCAHHCKASTSDGLVEQIQVIVLGGLSHCRSPLGTTRGIDCQALAGTLSREGAISRKA